VSQTNDDFHWTQESWGRALRCKAISAPHLFSTKDLELRKASGQPAAGWDQLAVTLGVRAGSVLRPKQVHGDAVTVVSEIPARAKEVCRAAADIIIASSSDVAVAVQAADCVPLLFEDRRSGAVAAAHAGWRGTAAGVARKTIEAMCGHFGADQADITVAIGPSIGPCCYEVGEELLEAFGADRRKWFYRLSGRLMLNLWSANIDQLVEAGVNRKTIHVAELCTAMHPDLFPSYRRDGENAGRLAAAIRPG
jgi:purine-nucleoside/S-methyl-5'-thioadenosine phosphorylase / adenosine deaminase